MERGNRILVISCIIVLILTGVHGDCSDLYNAMLDANKAVLDAQDKWQTCVNTSCDVKARNCAEIQAQGYSNNGVYTVYYLENNDWKPIPVYCDLETAGGGWIVFQRRQDGSEDFYRNWANYTDGFGDMEKEFWLGNYNLHRLTSGGHYRLRIDLGDFKGETRYAEYSSFSVGAPSTKFALRVAGYSGDAGDSFGYHNGMGFTTKDIDNDAAPDGQCALLYKGAWWYKKCHQSNLNGLYLDGPHTTYAIGIDWRTWHGYHYSLKFTEMKFKPS